MGGDERGREGGEGREGRGEGREDKGGERKAFLVMWPRRLSALNPPLVTSSVHHVQMGVEEAACATRAAGVASADSSTTSISVNHYPAAAAAAADDDDDDVCASTSQLQASVHAISLQQVYHSACPSNVSTPLRRCRCQGQPSPWQRRHRGYRDVGRVPAWRRFPVVALTTM